LKKPTAAQAAQFVFFLALAVLTDRYAFNIENMEHLSFQFLALGLCGALLGPAAGAVCAVLSDLVGMAMGWGAPFFIGFTISAALRGGLYGMGLYHTPITFRRCLLVEAVVSLGVDLLLATFWFALFGHVFWWQVFVFRLPLVLVEFPVKAYLLYYLIKKLIEHGHWPRHAEAHADPHAEAGAAA